MAGNAEHPLFTLCLSIFAVMLGLGFIVPLLPIYAEMLGATGFEIGLVFASFALVRALTTTPFGTLSDFFGRKLFMALGMALYVVSSTALTFAETVQHLIFCRILQGVGSALVVPAAAAYVADLFAEDKRGEAMGVFNMAFFAGIGFGPLVGGVLADKISFHTPFYACSILAFIGLILTLFKLREPKRVRPRGRIKISYGFHLLANVRMTSLIISRITLSIGISSLIVFFPVMVYRLGMSTSEMGILLAVQAAALIAFQKKFGRLSDKYGRKCPIVIGSVAAGLALILLGFSETILEFLIFLVVFGVSGGLSIPASSAAVADISDPREFGEAMGLFTTSISIGMTLGPIVGGLILDYLNITGVFHMAATLLFAGATILLLMFKE